MELQEVTSDELESLLIKVDTLIEDHCDASEEDADDGNDDDSNDSDNDNDNDNDSNDSQRDSHSQQVRHDKHIDTIIKDNLLNKKIIPHDFDILCRLFYTFTRYHYSEQASELVLTYGDALVQQQEEYHQYEARIRLAQIKAEIEGYSFASLMRLMKAIEQEPAPKQNSYDWYELAGYAEEHKHYAIERSCAEGLHAINILDDDEMPALANILLLLNIATIFEKEGIEAKAEKNINDACTALKEIQGVNNETIDSLLNVAERLIALRGEQTEQILLDVQNCIANDLHNAHKRDIDVKLARMLAKHYYKQGKTEQAIEKGFEGYYGLTGDYDEPHITECLYDWLYEIKDYDRLCWLLFESGQRQVQQDRALELCKKFLDEGIEHVALPALLVLLAKELEYKEIKKAFDDAHKTKKSVWVEDKLKQARLWAKTEKDNTVVDIIDVTCKFYACRKQKPEHRKKVYQQILPTIEKAIAQCPEYIDQELVTALIVCRAFEYGLDEMFEMPFVPLSHAGWCYNMGNYFDDDDDIAKAVKSLGEWPKKKADALAIKYYQHGMQRFEDFFNNGAGRFRDGDIHTYSMLCNNLAIEMKYLHDDHAIYDETVEIHKKGIAVSPFAEHYDGIMKSYSFKGDDDNYLIAADELWRFAIKHGYSRFDVYDVIKDVAEVYNNNYRLKEIAIWLPRLEKWWQDLEDYEQEDDRDNYLLALSYVLSKWVHEKPDDALVRLTPEFLEQVENIDSIATPQNIGSIYSTLGNKERALYYFTLAQERAIKDESENNIKNLERIINDLQKPWWKFW